MLLSLCLLFDVYITYLNEYSKNVSPRGKIKARPRYGAKCFWLFEFYYLILIIVLKLAVMTNAVDSVGTTIPSKCQIGEETQGLGVKYFLISSCE